MSLALPDGWFDTGHTETFHFSAKGQLQLFPDEFCIFNDWKLRGRAVREEVPDQERYTCTVIDPDGVTTEVENFTGPAPVFLAVDAAQSSEHAFTSAYGPIRLGCKYENIPGTESFTPQFSKYYRLRFSWFADNATQRVETLAGVGFSKIWLDPFGAGWAASQAAAFTPQDLGPVGPSWIYGGQNVDGSMQGEFRLRELTVQGVVVDTAALHDGRLLGVGGGSIDSVYGQVSGSTVYSNAPLFITEDVDVPKFPTTEASGVAVLNGDGDTKTTPYTLAHTRHYNSWEDTTAEGSTFRSLTLVSDDTVRYPADDRTVLWALSPPRSNPLTGGSTYTPVTVRVAPLLDVLRPDGSSPTHFAVKAGSEGHVTVAGDHPVVIQVTAAGATIRRQFGATGTDLPSWRPLLGVGTLGHADPLFNPDASLILKHTLGEDVWYWGVYSYAITTWTADTAGTATVTVKGVKVGISDPHTTGSDRADGFSVTETPYALTYTINLSPGTFDYNLDLICGSAEAHTAKAPLYHHRIDAMEISFSAAGNYQLQEFRLASADAPLPARREANSFTEPGQVHIKAGFGAPVARGDYSALMLVQNGAFPLGNDGDQDGKGNEIGETGGYLRYCTILTGAMSGFILDAQLDIPAFWGGLGEIEGVTVTYTDALYLAACQDDYGNTIGPQFADWTTQGIFTGMAGDEIPITVAPRSKEVHVPNGVALACYTRWPTWTAVEALVVDQNGGRAPAGIPTQVAGVVVNTDAHGYVRWDAVPSGSTVSDISL